MANMYINAMTALWNNVGTLYSAIKMNVTDSGSSDSPASKLIDLQIGSVTKFNADKNGNVYAAGDITALGDLTVGGTLLPSTGDTTPLGSSNNPWSDLWLGDGAAIKWGPIGAASDVILQQGTNSLTVQGGDLLVEEPGTATGSVIVVGATQTLRNKTMEGGIIRDLTEFSTLAAAHRIGAETPTSATIVRRHNSGSLVLAGGMDTTSAYLELDGVTNATVPKGFVLGSGTGGSYSFNSTANTHSFKSNAGTSILTIDSVGISAASVISSSGQFSSNTHVYLGAVASGGFIHLRPFGVSSDVKQTIINSSGDMSVTGNITAGGNVTATATVAAKGTASGNVHFWLFGPNGEDRMVLYTPSASASSTILRVTGTQSFTFNTSGQFIAPGALFAGAALYNTDGNISGSVWDNLGYHDAYSAIVNRIESRATAWAVAYTNNCVQSMRVAGYVEYQPAPGGDGGMTNSGYFCTMARRQSSDRYFFGFRQLQMLIPSAGWLQATGW